MSKLKIEHGASKVSWVLLKTNIDESIANEIELMCEWSENNRKYIVNELLRFALAQSEEFQKYKAERDSNPSNKANEPKPISTIKPATDLPSKHPPQTLAQRAASTPRSYDMQISVVFQNLTRKLIEYRFVLSLGFSVAAGVVLHSLYPINSADPVLRLIAINRPMIYQSLLWSYSLFLYSTPFIVTSILFSLAYVHFYVSDLDQGSGHLPAFPASELRHDLYLVIGESHHQLKPEPSSRPQWLSIPERGLYTGVAVVGAIGSGKTQALILPAMRQLFAYRADDSKRKLSGVVLEVKGDLCRQLQTILDGCGRSQDYVEISLHGNLRYNPLNNDLDPYAQAYNIASIITAIWGRGKEPFWQQSYTDLVRYVIRCIESAMVTSPSLTYFAVSSAPTPWKEC